MDSEMRVLREWEAARQMGISTASLRRWRREGRGPKYIRMERCVGYLASDLEAYLKSQQKSQREDSRDGRVREDKW